MNDVVQIDNPFAPTSGDLMVRPAVGSAVAAVASERAIAEVKAAMVIARQFPRNQMQAAERIKIACQRPSLAERAVYEYSKGGTEITGPSIRLAEAMAQDWGNIQFGLRVLEQNEDMSAVQSFCWDLETNTQRVLDFQVPHHIMAKGRLKKLTDPRDIYELQANLGQRRTRACILAVIPGDIVDMALRQCDETMRAKEDCSPAGIKKLLDAFEAEYGVQPAQIEKRIQRRWDSMQPAQKVALRRIYTSLRDGMSSVEEWFEPIEGDAGSAEQAKPATGNSAAKDTLRKAAAKKPPAPKEEPKPAADPAPAAEQGGAPQTMGEQLGDEIPHFDKDEAPQTDFTGPKPATAEVNQTWLNPDTGKVHYAHRTQHGIKWYLQPQEATETAAPAAEAAAQPEAAGEAQVSEAQGFIREARHADDEDTLNDIQERFSEAKEGMSEADIKLVREALADRRNDLA